MTTLAIPLPRLRRLRPPPKVLRRKAGECLIWAAWTVFCMLHVVKDGGFLAAVSVLIMLLYARWMVRAYRELIAMIEQWLNDKLVKCPRPTTPLWLLLMGTWTIALTPEQLGLPFY